MSVPEKEDSMIPLLLSSTNWLVAGGSLEGSISLETSTAEAADVIPIGVLLERPADPLPCEITIFFRKKHEIHSIYVRSTARVYEVYYASDREVSSNEYLCTVRCGAAVQDVTPDMCERVLAERTVPNELNMDFPRCNSNNVMEDGWVEVEVSDSLLPDDRKPSMSNSSVEDMCSKTQIQYEATVDISDASPCMSITLRLLSLQIITSIHIDEIYIYADPVEDIDPYPPVSNVGAGSLLSMLVPGLLQLSKSGTPQFQDKGSSGALTGLKNSLSTERTVHVTCPDKLEISEVESSSMLGNSRVGFDEQHNEEKLERPIMASSKIVSDPDHISDTSGDESNVARGCVENLLDEPVLRHTQTKPGDGKLRLTEEEKGSDQSRMAININTDASYVRLENILDELVSRMGKIETFCSSFQESMLKPLNGIEMRLKRMEEQLDSFSKAPLSSETYPSTRISHLSLHELSFEDEGFKSSSAVDSNSHEREASDDLLLVSSPESGKISGLVLKAPEFTDHDDDDDDSNIGYSVDLTPKKSPKNGKCASIDSALASVLAAFVSSTTDKSSLHDSLNPTDVPNERQNWDGNFLDSAAVVVHSETDRKSVSEWCLGDKNCSVLYESQNEMCQSEKSCPDVINPDSTLNNLDMINRTGTNVQGNCLCGESQLVDDNSSAEIETHESKGFIIRAPEFPNEDDILDCGENSEPHLSNYPNAHSHPLPHSQSTPLALFLSSRKISPPRNSLNSHVDLFQLSTSGRNYFSLSTFQAQGGPDAMRTCSLLNHVNAAVEPSLVLNQRGSPRQLHIFHDIAAVEEENSSVISHSMGDADLVLKYDGLLSDGKTKSCIITKNILPCNELHKNRSSICIQDKECWVSDSEVQTAEGLMSNLLGKFKAAEPSSFDGIAISKLHPEYSYPDGMDSFTGAFVATDQKGVQTTGNSGSSETTVQCQSHDGISQLKSLFEPKQISSFISGQNDLTSNVRFCADKSFRIWPPLEILLDEKQYDELMKDDELKPVQAYVDPLEVQWDENIDDQVENSDYDNGVYGSQHNSPSAQDLRQNCKTDNTTLFDIEDTAVQFEISSLAAPASPHYPVCFSAGNPFPSLI